MPKHIFLIGPASVGKTTIGALLAQKIDYGFMDIDNEFCNRIKLIPDYIKEFGYAGYAEANSKLVDELINASAEPTVFATPSGYLVHEDLPRLVEKHLQLIKDGISILLLPSKDPLLGVDEIVKRQFNRWSNVNADKERSRFLSRFEKYNNYGDIKIYSLEEPAAIVDAVTTELSHFDI